MKYIDSPKISSGSLVFTQIINYSLPFVNGQYLSITGNAWVSGELGYRFLKAGDIIGILFSSMDTINRDIILYRNNDIIYTFSSINNNIYINNSIQFSYDVGDLVKIFVNNKTGDTLRNFVAQIKITV